MSLKYRLLASAYRPLRISNALLRLVGRRPGRLRVLIVHGISPLEEVLFAAHLRWLAHTWKFVDPQRFAAMISGDEQVYEDSLLLTFDDGFASNHRIAKTVLNPMGIRALFFVVSGFVALSEKDDWRDFIAQNIYPGMRPADIPDHWRNMGWDDLAYLLETGHSIGAHTASHFRLSQLATKDLEAEIVSGADALEQRLCTKIEHFAYPFGNLASFSPAALNVARRRFKYIYTGLRGNNAHGVPLWAIRRDAFSPTDSLSLTGAILEGGADWHYAASLAEYESWGRVEESLPPLALS